MDKPKNSIPHPPSPIAVLKETTEDIKNRLRTVENDLKDSAQRITKLEERMAAGAGRYKHSQPKRRAFSSWTSLAVCIVSVFLLLLGTIRILDHLNRVADNTAATSQRSTKVSHEQSSQKEEKPSNTLKDFDERIKKKHR